MQSVSRFALLACVSAFVAGAGFAAPVFAASPKTASSANILEAVRSKVAKPISAWLVGPSQASAFDAKDRPDEQGCLMVAEFDNGMIIGIHARAAGIVGMTVDTKQQTLTKGQPAALGMNIGADSYMLDAVATDASTIAVSLEQAGGGKQVVERLVGLGNFRLLIDEKPHYFSTVGFTDGLARLQACMGANMAVPLVVKGPNATLGKVKSNDIEAMRVETSGTQTPLALALPGLIPAGYRFVLDDVDPVTPISWQPGDDWVDVMRQALAPKGLKMSIKGDTIRITKRAGDSEPVVEGDQSMDEAGAPAPETAGVWTANAGDNLASVLQAWGEMAGVNVKVDLMGDLMLPHDVSYEGNFNDAVQKLLAEFSGDEKPVGVMANASGNAKPAPVTRRSVPPEKRSSFSTRTDTWKPRAPQALKDIEKPWAPMKQMSTVPDPADAPQAAGAKEESADAKPKAAKETPKKAAKKVKPKAAYANGKWDALQGTSLRDVLEEWGEDAGVTIVWMTQDHYPLPGSIKEKGKFEDAVAKLLAQYQDRADPPAAQLNLDPDTGEKALIIKNSRP